MLQLFFFFTSALTFHCYTIQYLCLQKWVTVHWKRTSYRQPTPVGCFLRIIHKIHKLFLSKDKKKQKQNKSKMAQCGVDKSKQPVLYGGTGTSCHLLEGKGIAQTSNMRSLSFAIFVSFCLDTELTLCIQWNSFFLKTTGPLVSPVERPTPLIIKAFLTLRLNLLKS